VKAGAASLFPRGATWQTTVRMGGYHGKAYAAVTHGPDLYRAWLDGVPYWVGAVETAWKGPEDSPAALMELGGTLEWWQGSEGLWRPVGA
jgi:hypothetical protein